MDRSLALLRTETEKFRNLPFDQLAALAAKKYADAFERHADGRLYQIEISIRWTSLFHNRVRIVASIEILGENADNLHFLGFSKAQSIVVRKDGAIEEE